MWFANIQPDSLVARVRLGQPACAANWTLARDSSLWVSSNERFDGGASREFVLIAPGQALPHVSY